MSVPATENAADPACPACAAPAAHWMQLGPYEVRRCAACGHRFTLGEAVAAPALEQLYHEHYVGFREDPAFERALGAYLARAFAPRLAKGARILDVGCGNGQFLAAARRAGYTGVGMDFSEAAAELCRSRGLAASAGDFLSMDVGRCFDAVTLWDVVEHLPEPLAFARRAAELLRPGGWLFMKTPAVGDLSFRVTSAVPRLAGALLGTPAHVQFFTERSMQRLADRAGFAAPQVEHGGGMRTREHTRSLRKHAGRAVLKAVDTAAGNGNWYAWMQAGGGA